MVGTGQHVRWVRRRKPLVGGRTHRLYHLPHCQRVVRGDYAREQYVNQWQQEAEDYYLNYYVRSPEYLQELPQSKQLEISNSLSRVRQYCEMPLKILKAETLVGGEESMDQILKGLFNRELDWSYPYLTYQEFLDACNLTEEELNLA